MDLAQMLVRSCARSFYDTKYILVIDALVIHSALRDDDLTYLMAMNAKEVHKLCGRLKEDCFIAVHNRSEVKEGQNRAVPVTYYYIDYRATIDAIKWRVYLIDKAVQGTTVKAEDKKEFFCSRCKSEWTMMEVLDKVSPQGFLCHKCSFLLKRDDDNTRGAHEQSTKLNAQFKFITDLLPKIDQVVIPENTFEKALAAARKVVRDATNPAYESVAVDDSKGKPTAVRGLTNTGPTSISVTLTTSEGPTEADIAADQARKEKVAAQNAMPFHFTHSTVSGEQVKFGSQPSLAVPTEAETSKKEDIVDNGEIDEYFERLKAEQAREAQQEAEEESEEEEEEEEEEEDMGFEDVIAPEPKKVRIEAATPVTGDAESDEDVDFEDV